MGECPFGMWESMFGSQENKQISFELWPSTLLFCSPERSCLPIYLSGGGGRVIKSCPTLCDLKDYSPPGCSVHGISQARILEWVAVSFFRGSSSPRNRTFISCITSRFFTADPPGKPHLPVYTRVYIYTPMHTCIHSICVCPDAQSRLTFCDSLDCSPPGSSSCGIFQARILEWIAISFSRGSSWHRDWTRVLLHGRQILYHWAIREAHTQYIHTTIYTHTYIHPCICTHTYLYVHMWMCVHHVYMCKCVSWDR